MVNTIGSMVLAENKRGWTVEVAHIAGGAIGGAITGLLAAALGLALETLEGHALFGLTLAGSLVSIALVAAASDLHLLRRRRFGFKRQTPRSWRYLFPARWAAFLNGVDLGLGWSTRVYFVSYGLVVAAAVGLHDARVGVLIGVVFGMSRALFVVVVERLLGFGPARVEALAAKERVVRRLDLAAVGQFVVTLWVMAPALGLH